MATGMADEQSKQQPPQPDTPSDAEVFLNAAEAATAEALDAAQAAMSSVENPDTPGSSDTEDAVAATVESPTEEELENASAFQMPSFAPKAGSELAGGIDLLSDVNLRVTIELGRTEMLVEDVLRLGEGSVVELDKLAGDPVDIYVNDRHVARGEVLVLNDNFCVRINEILSTPALTKEPKERKAG